MKASIMLILKNDKEKDFEEIRKSKDINELINKAKKVKNSIVDIKKTFDIDNNDGGGNNFLCELLDSLRGEFEKKVNEINKAKNTGNKASHLQQQAEEINIFLHGLQEQIEELT